MLRRTMLMLAVGLIVNSFACLTVSGQQAYPQPNRANMPRGLAPQQAFTPQAQAPYRNPVQSRVQTPFQQAPYQRPPYSQAPYQQVSAPHMAPGSQPAPYYQAAAQQGANTPLASHHYNGAYGQYGSQNMERFYHYPYVTYPHNYYGSEYFRSNGSMYHKYPAEMRTPVYNRGWTNYYPSSRRYHWGHHFILDVF